MNAWDDLPNAKHIDRVLESVKTHPNQWTEARDEVNDAVWYAALDVARDAAAGAILALIAYDDCAHFLEMTSDELKVWSKLSENPAAILLLPTIIAFEMISERKKHECIG